MPTVAHALLAALKENGAHDIFGIPGDFVLPLFKVIEESNILPNFTLSHEPAVGFAADASARYRGGLGVAVVTYGAGAFNIVNSIAGAYAERSPGVVIAGAPGAHERTSGYLLHYQARRIDTQLAVFKEITCDQAVLADPVSAPTQIARVLRSAREMSLPVYLEFLRDTVAAKVEPVVALPRHADAGALAECADEILERIDAAAAPVAVVDVEIRRDLIEGLEARAKRSARQPHQPKQRSLYPRGLPADDAPISPSNIATAINDLFDRHGKMPMTSDIGDCLFTAMEIDNTALAAPGYYAGMGFGVPAGIGVAAAGFRPLILVGDGAFQMTGWELGNCRRYGLDPIVVLFNNLSWEMLRVFQPESRFNDLDDWHFADIAASIGGVGERVTTRRELAAALDRAVRRR